MDLLTYVGHATTRVRLAGATVLTDPVIASWVGPLRRHGQRPDSSVLAAADAVTISHLHRDHLDLASLRRLPAGTPVIVPRGGGGLVSKTGPLEVVEVAAGEEVAFGALTIVAVPAIHGSRRHRLGPSAEPVGYLIDSPSGRVYFAGDTDLFEGLVDLRPVDLALLPVWGWGPGLGPGHLDPIAAATALTLVRPRLAVPIHWGTFFPIGLGRVLPGRLSRPPVEFAEAARRLAPEVEVRILQPGEEMPLGLRVGAGSA